ncbi:hypothetical protein DFQ27_001948 [Actinomortierella ambigua]|uniref:Large-conductance mechanosensitive channel n=1 Tax=Actinomortierella ambigua TaxID=1343610 RepID=A0A9P6QKW8_9FUNG|nr:hypothetical protein DFQ27_001948 [Actinomortierella ambigua]
MPHPIEEECTVEVNIHLPTDIDSDCDIERQIQHANHEHEQHQSTSQTANGSGKSYHRRVKSTTKTVVGGVKRTTTSVKGSFAQMERSVTRVTQVGGKLTKVPGVSHGVSLFADYRKFLDRGNVVDMAVAVVIGAAFTGIVNSLVTDMISPILAVASGKSLEENFVVLRRGANATDTNFPTREEAKASGSVTWNYGNFLQTVVNFFIISACVFVIVKVYEMSRSSKTATSERKCPYCDRLIGIEAKRCPLCTTWLHKDAYQGVESMIREVKRGRRSPDRQGHGTTD